MARLQDLAVGLRDALQSEQLLHGCGLHTLQFSWPHRGAMDAASSAAVGACFLTRVEARRGAGFAPGPLDRCAYGFLVLIFLPMLPSYSPGVVRQFFSSGGAIVSAVGGGPLKIQKASAPVTY